MNKVLTHLYNHCFCSFYVIMWLCLQQGRYVHKLPQIVRVPTQKLHIAAAILEMSPWNETAGLMYRVLNHKV